MTNIKTVQHVTTTSKHTIEIHEEHLRKFLKAEGYDLPREAEIVFRVPGGGDWSGLDIDIDLHNPIHITWTETNES